jgi:CheY-like chemotaxis protein
MAADPKSAASPGNESLAPRTAITCGRFYARNWFFEAAALFLSLACLQHVRASDSYAEALNKQFSSEVTQAQTANAGVAALEEGLRQEVRERSQRPEPISPPTTNWIEQWFFIAMALVAAIGAGIIVLFALRRWNQWLDRPRANPENANIMAEDPSMVELICALRADLQLAPAAIQTLSPQLPEALSTQSAEGQVSKPMEDVSQNHDFIGENLTLMRAGFQKLSRAIDDAERLKILCDLLTNVESVKESAGSPQLRSVRVLASALHGLLKQLSTNATNISPSALRTAAAALDLLELLRKETVSPELATNPAVRILAVDDDPISRRAISIALKKTFNGPDLAPGGADALQLVRQQPYDLIFLDVEMPGMDGFELCSKIHETGLNRKTPVVFVTSHCDFGSRAKSALVGAHDLIGKPFLAFEITVKALTLVLRARLEAHCAKPAPCESDQAAIGMPAPDSEKVPAEASAALSPPLPCPPAIAFKEANENLTQASATDEPQLKPENTLSRSTADRTTYRSNPKLVPDPGLQDGRLPSSGDFARAFLREAPAHLQLLQKQLELARTSLAAERHELLAELFIGVHTICAEAGRAQLRAASRVGSALEALLKKLLERPAFCTPSTLVTAGATLEALAQLCQSGEDLDLAQVRLLVVDDDPVAQRAMSGALQLAFGRPDKADCGEAALVLAEHKQYDLIFLDVIMPGMGGFNTCVKLHELALNRRTPIVFVTSQDDTMSRAEAVASGGCGFIPKPVLPCEIMLLALTHTVQSRLDRRMDAPGRQPDALLDSECVLAG